MKNKALEPQRYKITREDREKRSGHLAKVFWFTGLSGSGKSTLCNFLEYELFNRGIQTYVLDGDNIRFGLNNDLGFEQKDRSENLRRIAEVSKLYMDAGIVVLASFITPLEEQRKKSKEIIGINDFYQIYVSTPIEQCEERDVKGLYKKARDKEITNFTGIDSIFEKPANSDFEIDTTDVEIYESIEKLTDFVLQKIKMNLKQKIDNVL